MRGSFLMVLGLALLFMLGTLPAQAAGALFPPENEALGQCSSSTTVMGWTGNSVRCVDPLSGRIGVCPGGQVLTGIVNGAPQCTPLPSGSPPGTLCGWFASGTSESAPAKIKKPCNGFGAVEDNVIYPPTQACPSGYSYYQITNGTAAVAVGGGTHGIPGSTGLATCVKN